MDFSVYLQDQIRDHIFRTGTYSNTVIYVGLLDTGQTELTGNAYARVQRDALDANWSDDATDGKTANVADIDFPTPTPSDWSEAHYVALFDASSAGNELFRALLTTPITATTTNAASFLAGNLTIDFS